jgi:hypothetical protein
VTYSFVEYVRMREGVGEPGQVVGQDEPDRADQDVEKVTRFILLAARDGRTFHQFLPALHQVAAADTTGEMADLLHNVDWQGLRDRASKLLRRDRREDQDGDDRPVKTAGGPEDRADTVRPYAADSGSSGGERD